MTQYQHSPSELSPEAQPVDPATAQPAPVQPSPVGASTPRVTRRTRVSSWWVGLVVAAVILVALLIFIVQNSATVGVHYLGADGHISLAVALLLSAVGGMLLLAIPGSIRIAQLRRAVKKSPGRARADGSSSTRLR